MGAQRLGVVAGVEQDGLGDPGQVLGEQARSASALDAAAGGGQLGREARLDPVLGEGDGGALEHLLARGADVDPLPGVRGGLGERPRQEVGGRDASAPVGQQVLREARRGPVHDQAHERGRRKGVGLHVVDHEPARSQVVVAAQLLVGAVAAAVDRGEELGEAGGVGGHRQPC